MVVILLSKIPKSDNGPTVTIINEAGEFYVTWNKKTMKFTLWRIVKQNKTIDYEKIATSMNSPIKLYNKAEQFSKNIVLKN